MPGGRVAVTLFGEIDIVSALAARDVLADATSRAVAGITIDLAEVTFIDAAGLGVLAGAYRRARHLPDGLRLDGVPARVRQLLAVTGLDRDLAASPPRGQAPARACRPVKPVTV